MGLGTKAKVKEVGAGEIGFSTTTPPAGKLGRAGRTPPSPVPLQGPFSGADLLGASPKRSL